ncbi:MAG TPA: acetyltransferase [Bryobacteraceae bacterium]|jgi:sugar O-acyltransferase (sialic acid O-acetyltransferase NeuD family)|nr:acetyltransferase [Bryobacteraceae bacterium]
MSNLLIWGAGGHGKVVLDVARSTGAFNRIQFLDDRVDSNEFCGCPLLHTAQLQHLAGSSFLIAIGDNRERKRCYAQALGAGLLPATLMHSSAVISPSARVGAGTVVMPLAVLNANSTVGENCIVNTGAIVEHDCEIAAHVHLSPRVALGGAVRVGELAHLGIGAVVLPGGLIGDESVVGAGAVVLKAAPPRCTVVGIPARVLSCLMPL